MEILLYYSPFILFVLAVLFFYFYQKVVILEYEKALIYLKGRFIKIIGPGQYRLSRFAKVVKIDIRKSFDLIPGQEILTADGASVKITLIAIYEIADPDLAINKVQNYVQAFYTTLQAALREAVSKKEIDVFLKERENIGNEVAKLAEEKTKEFGIKLDNVSIRDVMLAGELKKAVTQVATAKQEGLAKLERARGETAALRNLANAAKMIEDNPNLLNLRILESINQTTGNTIVFGSPEVNQKIIKK